MKSIFFNRNPLKISNVKNSWEIPTQKEIKNSPQLINASLEDALKFGGDITRQAINSMNLRFDKKYVIVDTKIHMLMQGMCPAIPGWHTDGAPRNSKTFAPAGSEAPDIYKQEDLNNVRYHILETGLSGSHTEFIANPINLEDEWIPNINLYKNLTNVVNNFLENELCDIIKLPYNVVGEFDWWNIHRGSPATQSGWRFLIRVTESDYAIPYTDLRDIMRTQIQVYTPENYGW